VINQRIVDFVNLKLGEFVMENHRKNKFIYTYIQR